MSRKSRRLTVIARRFDILNEQYAALLSKRVVVYVHDQKRHGVSALLSLPLIETHYLRKGRAAKAPRMHAISGWADGEANLTTARNFPAARRSKKSRPESQKANGSIRNCRPYLVRRGGAGRSVSGPAMREFIR
jgi:hypothetical protein